MSIEMTKTKKVLFFVAMIFSAVAVMANLVIMPVIYNIYVHFSEETLLVNYIVTGPRIWLMLSAFLVPKLYKYMSKRNVLLIGGILFAVSSIFGVAVNNIYYMCAMRTIIGISQGFFNVTIVAILAEIFIDEKIYAKYLGFFNCSLNLVGMALAYLAGRVASVGVWQDVYKLYFVSIPMLIAIVLFIPNIAPKKDKIHSEAKKATGTKKEPLGTGFWVMIVCLFIYWVASEGIDYFSSNYVAEHALGDEAFCGTLTSLGQIASLVVSILFGWIYAKFKTNTMPILFALGFVATAFMYFFPSRFSAIISYCLLMIIYGLLFSFRYAQGSKIVPESRVDDAISIAVIVCSFGTFVNSYFATFMMKLFKTEFITPVYRAYLVMIALVFIIQVVYNRKTAKGN